MRNAHSWYVSQLIATSLAIIPCTQYSATKIQKLKWLLYVFTCIPLCAYMYIHLVCAIRMIRVNVPWYADTSWLWTSWLWYSEPADCGRVGACTLNGLDTCVLCTGYFHIHTTSLGLGTICEPLLTSEIFSSLLPPAVIHHYLKSAESPYYLWTLSCYSNLISCPSAVSADN